MKINIELDTEHDVDRDALVALVDKLAGRVLTLPSIDLTMPNGAAVKADMEITQPSNPAEVLRNVAEDFAEGTSLSVDPEAFDKAAARCDSNPEGAPALDSRGLPWDERIHAGTKATNADGSWRNKRGVDKDLLEEVEAELGKYAWTDSDDVPTPDVTPVEESEKDVPDLPEPPTPDADAPPPPAPTEEHPSFKDAMAVVTAGQRDGSIDQTAVTEAAKALGLTSVIDLAKPDNAHLRAAFIATLG